MKRQVRTLTRNVRKDEAPWLDRRLNKGEVLFVANGPQFGVIGPGVAMSEDGELPFFEVPESALGPKREAE